MTRVTYERLLKEREGMELCSLWMFFAYTARWQHTNQARASIAYVCRGTKWCEAKVQRLKNRLIEMGLLENVRNRDEKGAVSGWFVRVRHLVKVSSARSSDSEDVDDETQIPGFSGSSETEEQMLSDSKVKCLGTEREEGGDSAYRVKKVRKPRKTPMPPTREELIAHGEKSPHSQGVNVVREVDKMILWYEERSKIPSRLALTNWLERAPRFSPSSNHNAYAPTMEKDFTPEGKPMCTGSRLNALMAEMEAAEAEQMEVQDAA
jgi:hypothetical protein